MKTNIQLIKRSIKNFQLSVLELIQEKKEEILKVMSYRVILMNFVSRSIIIV